MAEVDREIAQRELRNDVSAILGEVAAGARLRVTVRGKPVADLVPVTREPRFVPRDEFRGILARAPLDPAFLADVQEHLSGTVDEL